MKVYEIQTIGGDSEMETEPTQVDIDADGFLFLVQMDQIVCLGPKAIEQLRVFLAVKS